jgi:hypothetical protein
MAEIIRHMEQPIVIKDLQDSSDFIMVRQHTWGLTKGTSFNPVLKTIGLSDCVGVAIHDRVSLVTGLLHMDGGSYLRRKQFLSNKPNYLRGPREDILEMLKASKKQGMKINDDVRAFVTQNWDFQAQVTIATIVLRELGIKNIEVINEPNIAISAIDGSLFRLTNYNVAEKYDSTSSKTLLSTSYSAAKRTSDSRSL